jgi:hypothetical protein
VLTLFIEFKDTYGSKKQFYVSDMLQNIRKECRKLTKKYVNLKEKRGEDDELKDK